MVASRIPWNKVPQEVDTVANLATFCSKCRYMSQTLPSQKKIFSSMCAHIIKLQNKTTMHALLILDRQQDNIRKTDVSHSA